MGLVSSNGLPLTKLEYDTIYNFQEGIAVVGRGQREVNQFGKVLSDFKYGYINQAGQLVVPTKYEYVENFSEGVGYVLPSLHADLWFDKQGKIALALRELSHAESFRGNMAYVNIAKVGFREPPDYPGQPNPLDVRGNYIDHQGRLLVPWKYDTIAPYFPGYLRPVRKNGKWGFLDSLARVVRLQYDDIDKDSAYFWQNLRRVRLVGRVGFMDTRNGQVIIAPKYEDSKPSQSALVWVSENGRWGCLNKLGQVIIPFQYHEVRPFEHGLSVVGKKGQWGLIDTTGKLLAPIRYDNILSFQDGRAVVKYNDKYGFLAPNGSLIIPTKYNEVSHFKNGQAYATYWGLFVTLDREGRWTKIKLQTTTLQALAFITVFIIVAGLTWSRKRRYRLQNKAI